MTTDRYPVCGRTRIRAGDILVPNRRGRVQPGRDGMTRAPVGFAVEDVDNRKGRAGAATVGVTQRLAVGYLAVDELTLDPASGPPVGTIIGVDDATLTWVRI